MKSDFERGLARPAPVSSGTSRRLVERGLGYAALLLVGVCSAVPGASLDVHDESGHVDGDHRHGARR